MHKNKSPEFIRNIMNNVEDLEIKAYKEIHPHLKEHLDYSKKVYNFCFKIHYMLDNNSLSNVGDMLKSQIMILMRITDFLRCIHHTLERGYPEQACTLAASIFELTHTAVYFSYDQDAMKKWLDCKDVESRMPNLIGKRTYTKIVEHNCNILSLDTEKEKKLYNLFCGMKHSHPTLQDILIKNDEASFLIGPYSDDRAIKIARFVLHYSGRLIELLITQITFPDAFLSDDDQKMIVNTLTDLKSIRDSLNKYAPPI